MPNDPKIPNCPKCKSNDDAYAYGDRNWQCLACGLAFDDDPDEGGTHSNDPTRSAERNEEYELRQAAYHKRYGRQPRRP